MQLKTILNRIQKHRGFVYGPIRLRGEGTALRLEVEIYPHLRNRPRCSGCGHRGPQYDTLPPRWFEFVPLWGVRVFFLYRMRRVDCATCGHVRVEQVPWAEGKHQLTTTYAWFLAWVGEASELVRGGGDLSDQLGQRVPRSGHGRHLGPGAPGSDGD